MQELIDELGKGWRAQRSLSQMTLGELIFELEKWPENQMIQSGGKPHSYRGYYSDLAIEPTSGCIPVGDLLKSLKESLGKTFEGYKGGDFYMDKHTPMWLSYYGDTGLKIMGIVEGEILSIQTAEDN